MTCRVAVEGSRRAAEGSRGTHRGLQRRAVEDLTVEDSRGAVEGLEDLQRVLKEMQRALEKLYRALESSGADMQRALDDLQSSYGRLQKSCRRLQRRAVGDLTQMTREELQGARQRSCRGIQRQAVARIFHWRGSAPASALSYDCGARVRCAPAHRSSCGRGPGAQPPENFWEILLPRVHFYNRVHFLLLFLKC